MQIHVLMHEAFEAPGAIEQWAVRKGHTLSFTRFYLQEKLPTDLGEYDFIIIMGGPQCPDTTREECPYFHRDEEIAFIRNAVNKGTILLGICLGAQLIGEALGARYEHSPHREIGVFEIRLTPEGRKDPVLRACPDSFPVGHWHGDMPGLTPTSEVLATSEGCPRQIVRYAPNIYGFQCHFEFTEASIDGMIRNSADELACYAGLPFVETADALRQHDYAPMNRMLFGFLDHMQTLQERSGGGHDA